MEEEGGGVGGGSTSFDTKRREWVSERKWATALNFVERHTMFVMVILIRGKKKKKEKVMGFRGAGVQLL